MNHPAHVYRHNRRADDIPNREHAAAVLSPGPWVLVHFDGGWRESGCGYNEPEDAVYDGRRLGNGRVVLHELVGS